VTARPLVLALLVLGLVACREGVKRGLVSTPAGAPAPPAGQALRVEYYQISDG
jgi:hypothetical protein